MALPTNVGKGTVRGSFIDFAGNPIEGTVTLTAVPKRLTNATASPRPVTILPKPVTVPLVNGEFTRTDVIATDDPDNSPHGWTYRVSFNFAGGTAMGALTLVGPGANVRKAAIQNGSFVHQSASQSTAVLALNTLYWAELAGSFVV